MGKELLLLQGINFERAENSDANSPWKRIHLESGVVSFESVLFVAAPLKQGGFVLMREMKGDAFSPSAQSTFLMPCPRAASARLRARRKEALWLRLYRRKVKPLKRRSCLA